MYTVIKSFTDLQSTHVYSVGDIFPHDGVQVSAKRINELTSKANKLGVPLIKEVKETPKRTSKKKDEE